MDLKTNIKKLKLCLVDEEIQPNLLTKILKREPQIEKVNSNNVICMEEVSHGTLCAALLLERLDQLGLTDYINLRHFSISECANLRTYSQLVSSLRYCVKEEIDLVSMSVGVLGRTCAAEFQEIMDTAENTLIVAAASNNQRLTYPAAMPSVLGIKHTLTVSVDKYAEVTNPPDGIEIMANLSETEVMRTLYRDYGMITAKSNSILVPQICAEIAAVAVRKNIKPTKRKALQWLTKGVKCKIGFCNPYRYNIKEDDMVPVILLEYSDNDKMHALKAGLEIKKEFEHRSYSCTVISDLIGENDFIHGNYHLDKDDPLECVFFFQVSITDSLILLLTRKNVENDFHPDLIVPNWISEKPEEVCVMALDQLSEDCVAKE